MIQTHLPSLFDYFFWLALLMEIGMELNSGEGNSSLVGKS